MMPARLSHCPHIMLTFVCIAPIPPLPLIRGFVGAFIFWKHPHIDLRVPGIGIIMEPMHEASWNR